MTGLNADCRSVHLEEIKTSRVFVFMQPKRLEIHT
jgi:hypothetical protein